MEVPQRLQLFNRSFTSGPIEVEDTFQVDDVPETIEVRGTAVRGEDAPATGTIQLLDPEGTVVFERTANDFEGSQVVSLVDVVAARPGEWRFVASVPRGTSFFAEVIGYWGEVESVDYSS
jgi:hypothetical protein